MNDNGHNTHDDYNLYEYSYRNIQNNIESIDDRIEKSQLDQKCYSFWKFIKYHNTNKFLLPMEIEKKENNDLMLIDTGHNTNVKYITESLSMYIKCKKIAIEYDIKFLLKNERDVIECCNELNIDSTKYLDIIGNYSILFSYASSDKIYVISNDNIYYVGNDKETVIDKYVNDEYCIMMEIIIIILLCTGTIVEIKLLL
jgi:hypothetical protein